MVPDDRGPFYYRLHSRDAVTGTPWPAIHFSRKGRTRFDPIEGVGTPAGRLLRCGITVRTYALLANHFYLLCEVLEPRALTDPELLDRIEALSRPGQTVRP